MSSPSPTAIGCNNLLLFPLSLEVVLEVLDCLVGVRVGARNAEWEPCALLGGHLLLQAFRISLVRQHLLFLEGLLSEPDFNLDYGAFIDNASARLTLVYEEFMTGNPDGLSLLKVAHQPSEEVRLQDLVSN